MDGVDVECPDWDLALADLWLSHFQNNKIVSWREGSMERSRREFRAGSKSSFEHQQTVGSLCQHLNPLLSFIMSVFCSASLFSSSSILMIFTYITDNHNV